METTATIIILLMTHRQSDEGRGDSWVWVIHLSSTLCLSSSSVLAIPHVQALLWHCHLHTEVTQD